MHVVFMRDLPERKQSPRLGGWNYRAPGRYFVTICSHEKHPIFGAIENDQMNLNDIGRIVRREWTNIPSFYQKVAIDEFIIMPNHLHGIIILKPPAEAPPVRSRLCRDRPSGAHLSRIIGNFKSYTSRHINSAFGEPGNSIWQKSYHDRIIRSDDELEKIRSYILHNPSNWSHDPNRH